MRVSPFWGLHLLRWVPGFWPFERRPTTFLAFESAKDLDPRILAGYTSPDGGTAYSYHYVLCYGPTSLRWMVKALCFASTIPDQVKWWACVHGWLKDIPEGGPIEWRKFTLSPSRELARRKVLAWRPPLT